jgi:hypothetical protein
MVSLEVHRTLKTTTGLLLAAVIARAPAFADTRFEPVARDEQQRRVVELILEKQHQDGPHSASLIVPMTELALLYQESGQRSLATAAFETARQVVRATYGLHSIEQAPLMRQLIANEEARGNLEGAWELEQQLLALARRYPNDVRTVPIFHEIADKRMNVLARYVDGEIPPEVILGCYYQGAPNAFEAGHCTSGSKGDAIRALLRDAWRNYSAAISVLGRNELYASDELRELEMDLVRSSFLSSTYAVGARSLRRLLSYDVASSAPWLNRVDALVQMADWDLLFSESGSGNQSALETYRQAYRELRAKGVAQESIEQLLSPKIPVVLPAFLPNPLASDDTQPSADYVDVSFEITKFGASRKIEVLEATPNVTRATKNDVVHLVARSRFRPRITDGLIVDTSPIVVRYHLSSSQPDPVAVPIYLRRSDPLANLVLNQSDAHGSPPAAREQ